MGVDRIDREGASALSGSGPAEPGYMSGFGGQFETEAAPGAQPRGRNSPQRPPFGLFAEQLSGSAFTAPRQENRRSWLYRLRPTAQHGAYREVDAGLIRSAPFDEVPPSPNRMRWDPLDMPAAPTDFVQGLTTLVGCGEAGQSGLAAHVYRANCSMTDSVFYTADGELQLIPQAGRLRLVTELGVLDLAPGEFGVVPRGVRFRAELPDGEGRGYALENYGAPMRLPELGPIGANGLANPRDS